MAGSGDGTGFVLLDAGESDWISARLPAFERGAGHFRVVIARPRSKERRSRRRGQAARCRSLVSVVFHRRSAARPSPGLCRTSAPPRELKGRAFVVRGGFPASCFPQKKARRENRAGLLGDSYACYATQQKTLASAARSVENVSLLGRFFALDAILTTVTRTLYAIGLSPSTADARRVPASFAASGRPLKRQHVLAGFASAMPSPSVHKLASPRQRIRSAVGCLA